jgi:hypothetical protein
LEWARLNFAEKTCRKAFAVDCAAVMKPLRALKDCFLRDHSCISSLKLFLMNINRLAFFRGLEPAWLRERAH